MKFEGMDCLVNVLKCCMHWLNSVHSPNLENRMQQPRRQLMMKLIHLGRVLMGRYAPTYDIDMAMVKLNHGLVAEIVVNSIASNIAVKPMF